MHGLTKYYGDNPWALDITRDANSFSGDNRRRPLDTRRDLEPDVKDFVMWMTNVLTAKEALVHTWFIDVS